MAQLLSPLPGTFYRRPAPDKPSYKEDGDSVAIGDTVGLIEVMKLCVEGRFHSNFVTAQCKEAVSNAKAQRTQSSRFAGLFAAFAALRLCVGSFFTYVRPHMKRKEIAPSGP